MTRAPNRKAWGELTARVRNRLLGYLRERAEKRESYPDGYGDSAIVRQDAAAYRAAIQVLRAASPRKRKRRSK